MLNFIAASRERHKLGIGDPQAVVLAGADVLLAG